MQQPVAELQRRRGQGARLEECVAHGGGGRGSDWLAHLPPHTWRGSARRRQLRRRRLVWFEWAGRRAGGRQPLRRRRWPSRLPELRAQPRLLDRATSVMASGATWAAAAITARRVPAPSVHLGDDDQSGRRPAPLAQLGAGLSVASLNAGCTRGMHSALDLARLSALGGDRTAAALWQERRMGSRARASLISITV